MTERVPTSLLPSAVDAVQSAAEAPLRAYLRAAAQAFLDNDWLPADEACQFLSDGSGLVLRVGRPDIAQHLHDVVGAGVGERLQHAHHLAQGAAPRGEADRLPRQRLLGQVVREDATEVGFWFYPKGVIPTYPIRFISMAPVEELDIPPNSVVTQDGYTVLKAAAKLQNFQPHLQPLPS